MSSDVSILIEGLGKSYLIDPPGARATTIRELMVDRLRHPVRRTRPEAFWALRDVTFSVAPGEVIGVIGANGAGKSTLLKLLCRITEPSEGTAVLRGRVGSLLEVGTGFHPELTGRENVYLNGAILGMPRREIDRLFDDIVEFAGVEAFLETPVKRYSSGMYVRLAFAVAAHLQPEILIVDEVLAVGDAEFQQRCLGRMEEAAHDEGRTILFVSHNLAAVESLCDRAVFLRDGRSAFQGSVEGAVAAYLGTAADEEPAGTLERRDATYFHSVGLLDQHLTRRDQVRAGDSVTFRIGLRHLEDPASLLFGMHLRSGGTLLASVSSRMYPTVLSEAPDQVVSIRVPRLPFAPGPISVDLGLKRRHESGFLEFIPHALTFEVVPSDIYESGYLPTSHDGIVLLDATVSSEPTGSDA